MALTDNLLAFYKLSDLSDSSGNNRTLTNNGNVSFASGKIGNAAVFDGTNSLDSNFVVPDTGDFTITSWFNPAGGPFALVGNTKEWAQGFFEIGSSDPGLQDGKIRLYLANSTEIVGVATDDQFTESVWNHVAVRRSGSTFKIWLNGVLQSATYEYSGSLESDSLTLGKSTYTHFNGSMDAFGIWNRALSDAEVAALYNNGTGLELEVQAPVVDLEDGLQAFYKLSDLTDSSGNNRTLTNNGNVSFASGKIGNAAVFDGSNQLQMVNPIAEGTEYSIAGWVKFSNFDSLQYAFSFGSDMGVLYHNGVEPAEVIFTPTGGAYIGVGTPSANDWHFIYASRKANGDYAISIDNGALVTGNAGETYYGTFEIGNLLNGSMDAVGIWNRALSDAEVAELYNGGAGIELNGEPQPTLVKLQAPVKFFGKIKFGV